VREPGVSTDKVIKELKKEDMIGYVNKGYPESHRNVTIRVEMWSFYQDKRHQIWLWWGIDHDSGEARAFRFGTREHENPDKLMELLKPFNLGKVYRDGNYGYYERFSSGVLMVTRKNTRKIEREHLSLRAWCARLVRKGIRFSKTERTHKIVVALVINAWFLGRVCLIQ
jgi:IS1 family transposase